MTPRVEPSAREQRALLGLCARATSHPEQLTQLATAARTLPSWDGFVEHAEQQGMGPLAHLQLSSAGAALPEDLRRGLVGLTLRHRRTNAQFLVALRAVLDALAAAGIGALVLKGAALCRLVYPQPGLRPMRDIDLLVRPEQLASAQAVLAAEGFSRADADDHEPYEGHYHAPPMCKRLSGPVLSVELHTRLGIRPTRACRLRYDELAPRAEQFDLEGAPASTLGKRDLLWLVYRHAFGLSVRSEAYRLIWLADLVSAIEAWACDLDFDALGAEYPQLCHALPWLHFVTPYSPEALARLPFVLPARPSRVGEDYSGWPRVALARRGERSLGALARETLWPSPWWLALRHGAPPNAAGFARAWLMHVRDLW